MKLKTTTTVYCGCDCGLPITGADGLLLPADQLADNYVFEADGSLDYVELFHRAHVHGQRLTDSEKRLYTVLAPRYVVTVEHPGVTLTTQLDLVSARYAVHSAVAMGLAVACRPQQPDEANVAGVVEVRS
jgi:hypothetical protein